jgi:hypothetical protein
MRRYPHAFFFVMKLMPKTFLFSSGLQIKSNNFIIDVNKNLHLSKQVIEFIG